MPLVCPTREPSGQTFRLVMLGRSLQGRPLFEEGRVDLSHYVRGRQVPIAEPLRDDRRRCVRDGSGMSEPDKGGVVLLLGSICHGVCDEGDLVSVGEGGYRGVGQTY